MKHISSFLSQSGLERNHSNDWLLSLWQRTAPTALQQICRPVTYHDNCLRLQVESSIWLSRVRQQQKSLIRHLRHTREFSSLGKIKLEVSPRQVLNNQKSPNQHHRKLSCNNKELLLDTAAHLSDPELKLSLERLAKTASKSWCYILQSTNTDSTSGICYCATGTAPENGIGASLGSSKDTTS